jgi:hypothetical protein
MPHPSDRLTGWLIMTLFWLVVLGVAMLARWLVGW